MSELNALLATALVGTSRATLPPHADSPLANALGQIRRDDVESTLLARAALAGLSARAGRLPEAAPPRREPAPAETRPEAPPRVTRHLSAVLNTSLLPEWLALCAAAGWRVPHAHLPDLLDWGGRVDGELRSGLHPVLGERGRWLAAFSPDWRWFRGLETGESGLAEDVWDSATGAVRESLFRTLRAEDPATARNFLTAHFKDERAGVRKRLLEVLGATWTAEDAVLEPLLEETLSDRSEDVRAQARRLLQRLPGSAYNARMVARVRGLLVPEKVGWLGKLTGPSRFSLAPPAAPDPDLKRDGLDDAEAPAQRLRQVFAAAHPGALLSGLELTPAELLRLAGQFGAAEDLARAALDTEHAPLAAALLQTSPGLHSPELARVAGQAQLLAGLEDALRQMERGQPEPRRIFEWLVELKGAWSAALSVRVLRGVFEGLAVENAAFEWRHYWNHIVNLALTRADPHAPRPPLPDTLHPSLGELHATLTLRAQLQQDFTEVSP